MKTWNFNGERWYVDRRSALKRLRQWALWVGGWEKPNGKGWDIDLKRSPAPISLLGHKVTYYGWGLNVKTSSGVYVCIWQGTPRAYVSPDGTPSRAFKWFYNPPVEVIEEVKP